MEPGVFLLAIGMLIGIPAYTVLRLAKLKAARQDSPSHEIAGRIAALEQEVQGLQQELGETQERLDFAERLLAKPPQS